jgi:hypothetical protein
MQPDLDTELAAAYAELEAVLGPLGESIAEEALRAEGDIGGLTLFALSRLSPASQATFAAREDDLASLMSLNPQKLDERAIGSARDVLDMYADK